MPKVICTRPNASLNINGVNFTPTEDGRGVISEEISDDTAELFLSIEGYELAEQGDQKPAAAAAKPAAKALAAPAKPAAAKKADKPAAPALAPAPAPSPAPEVTAPVADGTGPQDTDSQEPAPGAAGESSNEDPNVF